MNPDQQFWIALATLVSTTLLSIIATIYGVKNHNAIQKLKRRPPP